MLLQFERIPSAMELHHAVDPSGREWLINRDTVDGRYHLSWKLDAEMPLTEDQYVGDFGSLAEAMRACHIRAVS